MINHLIKKTIGWNFYASTTPVMSFTSLKAEALVDSQK